MTNERVLLERALKALEHIGTMGNEEAGNIAAFALTEALDARQKLADEPSARLPCTCAKSGERYPDCPTHGDRPAHTFR